MSGGAEKKDKPNDEWSVMIGFHRIAFQESLPCKPFEFAND